MKTIIILEDSQARIDRFKQVFPHAFYCETALGCKEYLKQLDEIDLLFLDHDLGGEVYVDSLNKNTGMEVVRYLETNAVYVFNIVVHSLNIPAAKDMHERLQQLGYSSYQIPFSMLASQLERVQDLLM